MSLLYYSRCCPAFCRRHVLLCNETLLRLLLGSTKGFPKIMINKDIPYQKRKLAGVFPPFKQRERGTEIGIFKGSRLVTILAQSPRLLELQAYNHTQNIQVGPGSPPGACSLPSSRALYITTAGQNIGLKVRTTFLV